MEYYLKMDYILLVGTLLMNLKLLYLIFNIIYDYKYIKSCLFILYRYIYYINMKI